jgi:hypothetical protein
MKISGNPIAQAWVTEFLVQLGTEDGSDKNMDYITAVRDDFTGIQDANRILTYRFYNTDLMKPARHLRISPTKWVGLMPCLRFEAFYF